MSILRASCVAVMLAAFGLALSGCSLFRGSDYPNRDITLIIPYAPGGSSDTLGRILAQEMTQTLGAKVVPTNKPGASATLGTTEVVQSKPDGYTVGLGGYVSCVTSPLTMNTAYGGPEDYTPLVGLMRLGSLLAVRSDSPWKTFDDFVNDARAHPDTIRVSIAAKGDQDDAWIAQFNSLYRVRLVPVPFSGGGAEAMTALLGGHIEASTAKATQALPQVAAGKIRVLADLNAKVRNPAHPEIPTIIELGYDKTTVPLTGYFAMGPKGLDNAVKDKLVKAFSAGTKSASFDKLLKDNGFVADPLGPDELVKEIKRVWNIYSGLYKEMGISTLRPALQ